MKLEETANIQNPVAILKAHSCSYIPGYSKGIKSHFTEDSTEISNYTAICRNCMVSIEGQNLIPKWGLFNGSVKTIVKILFEEDKNLNHGDLPTSVIVDFPYYTGPIWDKNHPKVTTEMNTHVICTSKKSIISFSMYPFLLSTIDAKNNAVTGISFH